MLKERLISYYYKMLPHYMSFLTFAWGSIPTNPRKSKLSSLSTSKLLLQWPEARPEFWPPDTQVYFFFFNLKKSSLTVKSSLLSTLLLLLFILSFFLSFLSVPGLLLEVKKIINTHGESVQIQLFRKTDLHVREWTLVSSNVCSLWETKMGKIQTPNNKILTPKAMGPLNNRILCSHLKLYLEICNWHRETFIP